MGLLGNVGGGSRHPRPPARRNTTACAPMRAQLAPVVVVSPHAPGTDPGPSAACCAPRSNRRDRPIASRAASIGHVRPAADVFAGQRPPRSLKVLAAVAAVRLEVGALGPFVPRV